MKKIVLLFFFIPTILFAATTFTDTNTAGGLNSSTQVGSTTPTSKNDTGSPMTVPVDQMTTGGIPQSNNPANWFNQTTQNIQTESGLLNQIVSGSLFGDTTSQPLNRLLNQLFYIGLVGAVILAIVMIIRGGVEYMTIDAIASKENGKRRVQAAMGGLLLAFSAILILNTINPGLTRLSILFPQIKTIQGVNVQGSYGGINSVNTNVVPGSEGSAQFQTINNPDQANASADGVITINGKAYSFRSGGGGNGYLPAGTYTVTNGRLRSDVSSMMVDGYGYSFDLSDSYDSRVGANRSLLRIHPDGGNPGTLGCLGIQGGKSTQEQFYKDLSDAISKNGGKYTITVGK